MSNKIDVYFRIGIAAVGAWIAYKYAPPLLPAIGPVHGKYLDSAVGFVCGFILMGGLLGKSKPDGTIVQLGGITWNMDQFCRHWLITGFTGSGKTAAGLANILLQLSQNVPNWGGLCLDQKGLFWEILTALGKDYPEVAKRLLLIKVRGPLDPPESVDNLNFLLLIL
ncbi:MAG: hypothetical protein SGI71_05475 [Verrucomicrobiota bacterium]|nr:hypothetical protein [Verrucomicrobiota bacterium]